MEQIDSLRFFNDISSFSFFSAISFSFFLSLWYKYLKTVNMSENFG